MHTKLQVLSLAAMVLAVAGCAGPSNFVAFTKTSLGIDVETAQASASIAYDRVEGYSTPRFGDEAAPPIYASFDSDGGLFTRNIKQTYATGKAARLLAGAPAETEKTIKKTAYALVAYTPEELPAASHVAPGNEVAPKVMFFGTGTVAGLKLGFGTAALDSFTFGFKRKEMSIIPKNNATGDLPSVLALLDSNVKAQNSPQDTGFGIRQYFATGDAADALAGSQEIKGVFRARADSMLTAYRDNQRLQNEAALVSLVCLAKLPDSALPDIWVNLSELNLFDKTATAKMAAASAHEARALYAAQITLIDHRDESNTKLMAAHREHVCAQARKTGDNNA
jgi:hypothetical protein